MEHTAPATKEVQVRGLIRESPDQAFDRLVNRWSAAIALMPSERASSRRAGRPSADGDGRLRTACPFGMGGTRDDLWVISKEVEAGLR